MILSIADPTQTRKQAVIQLTGEYSAPNSIYDPTKGITTITIELPTGDFAGQTVQ